MSGISFKSVQKDGSVDWSAVRNVDLIKFESSITLQVLEWVGWYMCIYIYFVKQLNCALSLSLSLSLMPFLPLQSLSTHFFIRV